MDNFFQIYVIDGGPLMVPIIFCSIMLVGQTVRLMIRLGRSRVLPARLIERAAELGERGERAAFAREMADEKSPLGAAIAGTLREIDLGSPRPPSRQTLAPAVEDAAANAADDLYHEIGTFGTLYTVAPLLGLLGTIQGMMNSFGGYGNQTAYDIVVLQKGIREALVTTLWGLGVAIPAFVIAQMFQSKIRRYERDEMPAAIWNALRALYARGTAEGAGAPAAAPEAEAAAAGAER